jgi:RNA polymerase sigma-70 factor (ECF subfamily)
MSFGQEDGPMARVLRLESQRRSHAELLDEIKLGSAEAAAALYDEFGDMVNRLVWRLLGADPDHDDMVNQVFLNVFASIGSIANPMVLGSWISSVTVNTVRKEIRSRRYRRILHLMPEQPEQPDERMAPDRQLFVRRFYALVERMKTDDRIMFVLRFVEGRTVLEIAALTGASPATVKRRIARARKFFMKKARTDPVLLARIEDMEHEG